MFTEKRILMLSVSEEENTCTGILPNAFLEPKCIDSPRISWCEFTCADGYRLNGVPTILYTRSFWGEEIYIFCRNGSWITNFEDQGYGVDDLCLPEGWCFLSLYFFMITDIEK